MTVHLSSKLILTIRKACVFPIFTCFENRLIVKKDRWNVAIFSLIPWNCFWKTLIHYIAGNKLRSYISIIRRFTARRIYCSLAIHLRIHRRMGIWTISIVYQINFIHISKEKTTHRNNGFSIFPNDNTRWELVQPFCMHFFLPINDNFFLFYAINDQVAAVVRYCLLYLNRHSLICICLILKYNHVPK